MELESPMKKAAYILLIILLFAIAEGQDWVSSGEADTTCISITVHMVSAAWTFDYGGLGAEHGSDATFPVSPVADTFAADASDSVQPCDVIHQVFWIENIGGIALDFNTLLSEALTGPTWSHDNVNITCVAISMEDTIGGAYAFEVSDGDSLTPAAPAWIVLPETVGAADEFENLLAESPLEMSDGVWTTQIDQREYHLEFITPISSSTTASQSIYTCIIGKISD